MPSKHLIFCCPLLLLPSIFLSIRIFSSESALPISWPKYWHFSFSPSNEYSELISFRIDWFDLLSVQGPLKSLQHCNLKASEWRCCRCKFWKPVSWAMAFSRYTRVAESPPPGSNLWSLVLGPLRHQLNTSLGINLFIYGWRSLVGYSPWGCWELDMTERLHFHFSLSFIGEGYGNPLPRSCLENPRDRGAWWVTVYGVTQSRTQLKQLSSSSYKGVLLNTCRIFFHF